MAEPSPFSQFLTVAANLSRNGLGVPLLILALLGMMILPLPPFLLDLFFTFSISLSLIMLLASVYIDRPLDLSVFPTMLLVATLLRLALNIASTRIVLLEGHTGTGSAGSVIEAFGEFVIGGNYAVGLVVFAILVIINFVVVTKGAGRISEVSARFTLDALPGKQMAIDADLNTGLITQEQAQKRREEVIQEADFYGSMDGASKFVRGDAVAGILILFINIIGGLIIGILQHELSFAEAARNYTLLTIGDGLVAQIPSLLLSTAAAIIVTRVSSEEKMTQQVYRQVFDHPRALTVTAVIMGTIGIIPGMPNIAFLSLAAVVGTAAFYLNRQHQADALESSKPPPVEDASKPRELSWDDVAPVDLIGLEVGYRLIPIVDKNQGGQLMGRIKGVRKKLSQDLGFLIPSVHIRDNLELGPNVYRITLHGVPMGEAEIFPDKDMAINPGQVFGNLQGKKTQDPAFGLEAMWIEKTQRDHAQTLGYTVVDASTVVATHLSQILQKHAYELLGREEVQQLMDKLNESSPKLVEDLIPNSLSLGEVLKVLQSLLAENVAIKDMRTIAETLADQATISKDPLVLTAAVRQALSRSIVQSIYGLSEELTVITLDPSLEQILLQSVQSGGDAGPGLEPGLAERVYQSLLDAVQRQEANNQPAVLLVAPGLRQMMADFARRSIANLHVLAFNEIPDNKQIKVVSNIGQQPSAAPAMAPA
ncbi:MAG: flagellar biosynthesis protein FlhA [Gammaproteobacteria bacterium]|nr:flagellar biosynthesis protein FlhA [Gammaproteobacteria bacterium]MDH5730677.1 flagellar biosynthesis protein FlhA [Gammaproteobacteria bacterium]